MDVNRRCALITFVISVVTLVVAIYCYFIEASLEHAKYVNLIFQISISIFSSAFVVFLISFTTYNRNKAIFLNDLARDMSITFDYVDDYILYKSNKEIYYEAFYKLRERVINYDYSLFHNDYRFISKKTNENVMECAQIISRLRSMLYHMNFQVEYLEKAKKKENTYIELDINSIAHSNLLDRLLEDLNDWLLELKRENKFNSLADSLCKSGRISFRITREDGDKYSFENYYKDNNANVDEK